MGDVLDKLNAVHASGRASRVPAVRVARRYLAGLERAKVILPGSADQVLDLVLDRAHSKASTTLANLDRVVGDPGFPYHNPEFKAPDEPVAPLRASLKHFGLSDQRADALYRKHATEFAAWPGTPAVQAREILVREGDAKSLGEDEPGLSAPVQADPLRSSPAARLRELGVGGF